MCAGAATQQGDCACSDFHLQERTLLSTAHPHVRACVVGCALLSCAPRYNIALRDYASPLRILLEASRPKPSETALEESARHKCNPSHSMWQHVNHCMCRYQIGPAVPEQRAVWLRAGTSKPSAQLAAFQLIVAPGFTRCNPRT